MITDATRNQSILHYQNMFITAHDRHRLPLKSLRFTRKFQKSTVAVLVCICNCFRTKLGNQSPTLLCYLNEGNGIEFEGGKERNHFHQVQHANSVASNTHSTLTIEFSMIILIVRILLAYYCVQDSLMFPPVLLEMPDSPLNCPGLTLGIGGASAPGGIVLVTN